MFPTLGLTNSITLRWAILLLIGGIGVLIPQAGWASCGEYLAMPGHEHVTTQRLFPDYPPELPQRPCQGPHCRQAPPPSAPFTPVSVERHMEQWAFIPNFDDVPVSLESSHVVAPLLNAGAAHPLPIDRPPR